MEVQKNNLIVRGKERCRYGILVIRVGPACEVSAAVLGPVWLVCQWNGRHLLNHDLLDTCYSLLLNRRIGRAGILNK